jgi:hypothetical protein
MELQKSWSPEWLLRNCAASARKANVGQRTVAKALSKLCALGEDIKLRDEIRVGIRSDRLSKERRHDFIVRANLKRCGLLQRRQLL